MSRLYSTGAELQSVVAGVEVTSVSGSPTISTSTFRSGAASYRFNSAGAAAMNLQYQFKAIATADGYFARAYITIADLPAGTTQILKLTGTSTSGAIAIRLTSTGTLQLYNVEDGAQIGSDSAALSLNTQYCIELKCDSSTLASTAVNARIDGASFASGTVNFATGQHTLIWGVIDSTSSYDIFFDDIALNDDNGSFQNTWPGPGSIVHLRPNAAGDNNQIDGAASTNYQAVDEITPDDLAASSFLNTATDSVGDIDDYNIDATPAAINAGDLINVVSVGVRYNGVSSSSEDTIVMRVKAASAGTVEESASITPNSITWFTNGNAVPRIYPIILYDLPGASTTVWTKADLDTAQIGFRKSADSTFGARVTTVWMLVEYAPNPSVSVIKKVSGNTQATVKKASSVTLATIKKMAGVLNV